MASGIPFGDQVENSSGTPVSGAKVYFKIKGTNTNATTYTDSALTVPAANPVEADAAGWFNTYLDPNVNYDVEIKSANDAITYRSFSESPSATGSQPVDATLTALAGLGLENRKITRGTGVDTGELITISQATNINNLLDTIPANLHAAILAFTSTVDVSAYFKTMLETGGTWFIPDGNYLLGAKGADTNSVDASITKSITVVCGPRVQIVAEAGLDGDMIRAAVPSNGAGLSGKIDFIWEGGYFDQSDQDVSTSVPFIAEYPPVNAGTSATTDGLRVEGAYNPGSGLVNGIRLCKITNATFYCGDHWMTAGGDQSVTFGYGADLSVVRDCVFMGNRDLGVYMTPENTATAKGRCIIEGNLFVNCFGGASVKRSINGFSINDNEFRNCVIGASALWIAGNKTSDGTIAFNRFSQCQVNVRLDYCERVSVVFNASDDAGALEDDGATAVTAYSPWLINLKGSKYCTVAKNRSGGVVAAYSALNVEHIVLEDFDTGSGIVTSQYNEITDNLSDGLYGAGTEVASEADNNRIEGNYEITGSVKNFVRNGAASSEVRFDYSTGLTAHLRPVLFSDGTTALPAVARRADPDTGFGFDAGEVYTTVNASKRHRVLGTGTEITLAETVRSTGGNAGVQRTITSNLVTLASGSSVTLTAGRPAGATIVGVTTRITTALTGSGGVTGIQIGDGSDADRYGVITGLTSGLTAGTLANPATADPSEFRATAGNIVVTAVGGTFAGGVVRINVAYDYMLAAES